MADPKTREGSLVARRYVFPSHMRGWFGSLSGVAQRQARQLALGCQRFDTFIHPLGCTGGEVAMEDHVVMGSTPEPVQEALAGSFRPPALTVQRPAILTSPDAAFDAPLEDHSETCHSR